MFYKNSLKLIASNFSVVWKHLVYILLVGILSVGLIFAFAGPSVECLRQSGWFDTATSLISTIYTEPTNMVATIREIVSTFFTVLQGNFSIIWFSIIGLVFTGYLIPTFLLGIGYYNLTSITHKQLTSLLSVGYTQNLVSTFGSATKYSLVRLVFKLIFDFFKLFFVIMLFGFSDSIWTSLLCLSILSALLILITSLEITFFSGFSPLMVDKGGNPFKCLLKSIACVFKKFEKVFSNSIILTLTCVLVNVFIGLYTAFSGLLITIPATNVLIAYFGNVVYLTCLGQRYYLSPSIIVNPLNNETKPFDDNNGAN